MLLIPAIDLKNGQCVRLRQGRMEEATVFSEDPAAMARHWLDQGARRLHLVDLDGAFAGKPKNLAAIEAILEEIDGEVPVQLGGGIRDLDTIDRYVELGIEYVIIGTAAVKHPGFLQDACVAFPGHVMVGLDAKDGKVAIDGWARSSGHDVVELARKFEADLTFDFGSVVGNLAARRRIEEELAEVTARFRDTLSDRDYGAQQRLIAERVRVDAALADMAARLREADPAGE